MRQVQHAVESSIGKLFLTATDQGVTGLYWEPQPHPMLSLTQDLTPSARILISISEQLEEYFSGRRKTFEVAIHPQGTEFQRRVWAELSRIPYGETVSYAYIANRIGSTNAVRAVGSANGRNPLCIIVPCHRVINSSGSLGGYSGGLEVKTKLLELEKSFRS